MRIKRTIITLFFAVFAPLLLAGPAYAIDTLDNNLVCQRTPNAAVCQDNARSSGDPISGPNGIIATIFTWLVRITGIVSIIMVVVGGFKYVISGGDSAGVQSAKNTIIYAVVGLVVSGLAGVLVRFVVGRLG